MKQTILAIAVATLSASALAQNVGSQLNATTVVAAGAGTVAVVSLNGTGSVTAVSTLEGNVRAYGSASAYNQHYPENYYNYYYGYDYSHANTSGDVYVGNYYYSDQSIIKSSSTVDAAVENGQVTGLAAAGIGGITKSQASAPGLFSSTQVTEVGDPE